MKIVCNTWMPLRLESEPLNARASGDTHVEYEYIVRWVTIKFKNKGKQALVSDKSYETKQEAEIECKKRNKEG